MSQLWGSGHKGAIVDYFTVSATSRSILRTFPHPVEVSPSIAKGRCQLKIFEALPRLMAGAGRPWVGDPQTPRIRVVSWGILDWMEVKLLDLTRNRITSVDPVPTPTEPGRENRLDVEDFYGDFECNFPFQIRKTTKFFGFIQDSIDESSDRTGSIQFE